MANERFWKHKKGTILDPQTTEPTENIEGSIWTREDSAEPAGEQHRLKSYLDAQVRTVVTEDQVQDISNKTLDTSNTLEYTSTTGLAATTVPAAIDEVNQDLLNHIGEVTGAHESSAISYDNLASGLAADDVQEALDEIKIDLDNKATRALNNLLNVEINTDLLPASDGVTDIGSDAKTFNRGVFTHIHSLNALSLGTVATTEGRISFGSGNLEITHYGTGDVALRPLNGDIDANNNRIKNVSDPTALQDATTKSYVDGLTSTIPDKANRTLDNLTTTAINADLLPGTDNLTEIGSLNQRFRRGYFSSELFVGLPFIGQNINISNQGIYYSGSSSPFSLIAYGPSAPIQISTGDMSGAFNSGAISLTTGAVDTGVRGDINLSANNVFLNGNKVTSTNELELVASLRLTEIATPSTPAAGLHKIYPKNDGQLYHLNSAGQEVKLGSGYDLQGTFAITNNQVAPADVTGFLLNPAFGEFAKVDYSAVRKYFGDIYSGFNGTVHTLIKNTDGDYIVGGSFTSYHGDTNCPHYLCKIKADGSLDTTWNYGNMGFDGTVYSVIQNNDGDYLVGGDFTSFTDTSVHSNRTAFCKIKADGTFDTSWNTGVGFNVSSDVRTIVQLSTNHYIVGGFFASYNGDTSCPNQICKILSTGSLDTSWNYNVATRGFDGTVLKIIKNPDDSLIVGGGFTTYTDGVNTPSNCSKYLCKILASGLLDTSWNYGVGLGFNTFVYDVIRNSAGDYIVGGNFNSYNGNTNCPDALCKILANGNLDTSWNNGATNGFNARVNSVIQNNDGDYIVGGNFSTYNGDSSCPDRLCKINANGSLNTSWNYSPTAGFNSNVNIVIKSGSNYVVGGVFSSYNGVDCTDYISEINANGTVSPWKLYPDTYLREAGAFYIQYDADVDSWDIVGETFAGLGANIDFSMNGDQLQFTSSNISGTLQKNTLNYFAKYL
jgi:hypothetical protein